MSEDWYQTALAAQSREGKVKSLIDWTAEDYLSSKGNLSFDEALEKVHPRLKQITIEMLHFESKRHNPTIEPYLERVVSKKLHTFIREDLNNEIVEQFLWLGMIEDISGLGEKLKSKYSVSGKLFNKLIFISEVQANLPPIKDEYFFLLALHICIASFDAKPSNNGEWSQKISYVRKKICDDYSDNLESSDQNVDEWLEALILALDVQMDLPRPVRNKAEKQDLESQRFLSDYRIEDIARCQNAVLEKNNLDFGQTKAMKYLTKVIEPRKKKRQEKNRASWKKLRRKQKRPLPNYIEKYLRFVAAHYVSKRYAQNASFCNRSLRPLKNNSPLPSSYIGGIPHLPKDVHWPHIRQDGEKRALHFIAQISLADLPKLKANPLPKTGKLLFFLFSPVGVEKLPFKVIYVDTTKECQPSSIPMKFAREIGEESRKWLKTDDLFNNVDFAYKLYFGRFKSYPESSKKLFKHNFSYEFDIDLMNISRTTQSMNQSLAKLKKQQSKKVEILSQNTEYGQTEFSIRGGPYTWADINAYIQGLRNKIAAHKRSETSKYKHHDPAELGKNAHKVVQACLDKISYWEGLANSKYEWTNVSQSEKEQFLVDIKRILGCMKVAKKRSAKILKKLKEVYSESPIDNEDPGSTRYYAFPIEQFRLMFDESKIIGFNVRRAFHEGIDAKKLYPETLINSVSPSDNSGTKYPVKGFANGIQGNQILGFAKAVQDQVYEYNAHILLLQLNGSHIPCVDNTGCSVQFWIKPEDLKSKDWDKAFATIFCD